MAPSSVRSRSLPLLPEDWFDAHRCTAIWPNDPRSVFRFPESQRTTVLGAWAPDGQKIAFTVSDGEEGVRLATVRPDGTGFSLLDTGNVNVCCLSWQPSADRGDRGPGAAGGGAG